MLIYDGFARIHWLCLHQLYQVKEGGECTKDLVQETGKVVCAMYGEPKLISVDKLRFLARDSIRQHMLSSLYAIAGPSVRLSVCQTGGSYKDG